MLAKYWKKIGLIIVIVACIFNVMIKLINKLSLESEMLASAQYVYDKNVEEDKEKNKQNNDNQKAINQDQYEEYYNNYEQEESQRNRNN